MSFPRSQEYGLLLPGAPEEVPGEATERLTGQESFDTPRPSPRPGPTLIEVGFWADPRDPEDDRPHPSTFVDKEWGKTVASRVVALYIRSAFLESFELGYSFCRLCESSKGANRHSIRMGCCTMTDGKYVWPEGLAHYVTVHAVRPPSEFVDRAVKNFVAIREMQGSGRLRWSPENGGQTMPLEPATAVFLRDRTTLGIALPPEPEWHESSDGVCSCVAS